MLGKVAISPTTKNPELTGSGHELYIKQTLFLNYWQGWQQGRL